MAIDFLSGSNSWIDPDTGTNNWINPDLGASGSGGIGGLQNILNLVGGGMGIANTFKGYQPTAAEGAQNQALSNQNALIEAYLNPNSTVFKNVNDANSKYLNAQTQQGLNNLLQMNRKAQLMGRTTYFNPERQDESISRYLSNQADTNANTARSNALQQILLAANQYGNQASGYGNQIARQQQAQTQNQNSKANGINQIAQMLPMIMAMV